MTCNGKGGTVFLFPPSLQISKIMSTVDFTPEKNNGPQRLTRGQRRLERLFKMAGKYALTSKKGYSHYRDALDFMQDDAGMMEALFRTLDCSWTEGLAEIQRACNYYIMYGGCSREEKERVGWAMGKWMVMAAKIGSFSRLISEKLYYYEQIGSELEEIMRIRAKNAMV